MKNVIKSIAFCLGLLLIVELAAYILLPKDSVKKYGLFNTAWYDILTEKPKSLDAVLIGDSLTYNSISPMEIWHEYGYTTYDCADPGQIISDSLKNVETIIQHEEPKIIFFEGNVLFRNMKNKPNYVVAKDDLKKHLPIFKIHDNWKNLVSKDKYTNSNITKGYKYAPYQARAKTNNGPNEALSLWFPEGNEDYFKDIKKICDENNVELVLLSTPSRKSWNEARHNKLKTFAKTLNIDYLDMNEEKVGIDWFVDTKDEGDHLNYEGAKKVSNFLGEYMKKTNKFKDKRKDKKYASWNEAYKKYLISLSDVVNNQYIDYTKQLY